MESNADSSQRGDSMSRGRGGSLARERDFSSAGNEFDPHNGRLLPTV